MTHNYDDNDIPVQKNWKQLECDIDEEIESGRRPDVVRSDEARFRALCKKYKFRMPKSPTT